MSRQLTTIIDNVATNVQDDSSEFRSLATVYINKRYFQILRAINWKYINEDYTVTTVAGTQDYILPSDFNKELYVTDETNGTSLVNLSLEELVRDFVGVMTSSGQPERYTVFNSDDGDKKIRFHYVPDKAYVIQLPYYVKPATLVNSTDTTVLDLDDVIEVGATADAWRYKRQFSKAKDMDVQFTAMIQEHIWDVYNQPNKVFQFKPQTFNRDNL